VEVEQRKEIEKRGGGHNIKAHVSFLPEKNEAIFAIFQADFGLVLLTVSVPVIAIIDARIGCVCEPSLAT